MVLDKNGLINESTIEYIRTIDRGKNSNCCRENGNDWLHGNEGFFYIHFYAHDCHCKAPSWIFVLFHIRWYLWRCIFTSQSSFYSNHFLWMDNDRGFSFCLSLLPTGICEAFNFLTCWQFRKSQSKIKKKISANNNSLSAVLNDENDWKMD